MYVLRNPFLDLRTERKKIWTLASVFGVRSQFKFTPTITVSRGHSITTWTRWGGGGVKNVCFCPRSVYKNCPRRGGGQKMAKFCPRSCWMPPYDPTDSCLGLPIKKQHSKSKNKIWLFFYLDVFNDQGPKFCYKVLFKWCQEISIDRVN